MTDILVVDDDVDIRLLVCTLLTKNGYRAHPAKDYGRGMMIGRAKSPDIIIVDVDLGAKLDGLRLAEILQRNSPATRAIVITGNPSDAIRARAQTLKFQLLAKPLSPRTLMDAVANAESEFKRIDASCSPA